MTTLCCSTNWHILRNHAMRSQSDESWFLPSVCQIKQLRHTLIFSQAQNEIQRETLIGWMHNDWVVMCSQLLVWILASIQSEGQSTLLVSTRHFLGATFLSATTNDVFLIKLIGRCDDSLTSDLNSSRVNTNMRSNENSSYIIKPQLESNCELTNKETQCVFYFRYC